MLIHELCWIVQHHPELNEMEASEEVYQALCRAIQEAQEALDQGKIGDMIRGIVYSVQAKCASKRCKKRLTHQVLRELVLNWKSV